MEMFKKVMYGVLGILALFSVLLLICVLCPDVTNKISDLLYDNDKSNHPAMALQPATPSAEQPVVVSKGPTSDEVLRTPAPPEGYNMNASKAGTSKQTANEVTARWKQIDTSAGVSGRNGYVPLREEHEQLDDEAVEKLRNSYTYGETGEGLTFDEEYYPYYGMLDENGRSLYKQIYANAQAVNGNFNPVVPIAVEEVGNVFLAVYNDHPELFWLESSYRGHFDRNGQCVDIALQFNSLVDNLDATKSEFKANAEEILSVADHMSTDYEVERYIHNALLERITYDEGAAFNQSAYSALVNGRTVCAGYGRAFQYLMTEMGIPCYYSTGYAGENHAWNIVKLDGEYYNVDVTWDDAEPNTYNFFNKTDADFASTHKREGLSVRLPACSGTRYGNQESGTPDGTAAYEAALRTLEEVGFSEEQIIDSVDSYYKDCYRQLTERGGSCQFKNVVRSEDLWLKCYDGYMSDAYSAGYMDQVIAELGVQGCNVDIEAENLRDGFVLLHHNIEFL